MKKESQLEYVVRKLNDSLYNRAEVARKTGVSGPTMSKLASGITVSPSHETVEKLYDFFKSIKN